MNAQTRFDQLEQFDFRAHYENVAAKTVLSITRHKFLITLLVVIALVAAGLLIPQLPRKYTAEALVHPDLFPRDDGAKPASPLASLDGASMVASEARLISSDGMVRAVVKRLGLDHDRELPASPSPVSEGVDWLHAAILPETYVSSPLERATSSVRRKLTVTNDSRTYLISISFTAASPELAANVANAFALEYIRTKRMQRLTDVVTAASREFARRSAVYGEKHPSIVQAKTELELARIRLRDAANSTDGVESDIAGDEGVILAEPSPTPSGPKGLVILGLALISALVTGVGIALWLERRDAGRCSEAALLAHTGVPCLGMVPRFSDRAGATLSRDTAAALWAVAVGAGLIDAKGLAKVAMITSTLPREGTSEFTAGLAKVLVSEGQRVLLLDTVSQQEENDSAVSLDDVLSARARLEALRQLNRPPSQACLWRLPSDEASGTGQVATLRRAPESNGQRLAVANAQGAFRQLLADAREHFDTILIAAPPVTLFAETVLVGRNADFTLHVVQWNRTPLQAVGSAIQRLRNGAVQVNGVVLTDVNPGRRGNRGR
jgi:capsular polysaccharide biosynthesis protein